MSNAFEDKMVTDYLDGNSQFSRRYRAIDTDDVPAEMDAAILARANAATVASNDAINSNVVSIDSAVKTPEVARRKSLAFWTRIGTPMAIAASFVLVVSIMFDSGVRESKLSAPVYQEASGPAQDSGKLNRELANERDAAAPVSLAEATAAPATASMEQARNDAMAEREKSLTAKRVAQTDAVSPRSMVEEQRDLRGSADAFPADKAAVQVDERVGNNGPFKKEASQELAKLSPVAAPPPEASRQLANAGVSAPGNELNGVEVQRARRVQAQPATPPITIVAEAPPAPSASSARAPVPSLRTGSGDFSRASQSLQDRQELRSANGRASTTATSRSAAGSTASTAEKKVTEKTKVAEVNAAKPASAAPAQPTAKQLREADAGKWLVYIRGLRMTGKELAADREWDRFVKAYPNYDVAADDRARP